MAMDGQTGFLNANRDRRFSTTTRYSGWLLSYDYLNIISADSRAEVGGNTVAGRLNRCACLDLFDRADQQINLLISVVKRQ